jgi:hypothetical protein
LNSNHHHLDNKEMASVNFQAFNSNGAGLAGAEVILYCLRPDKTEDRLVGCTDSDGQIRWINTGDYLSIRATIVGGPNNDIQQHSIHVEHEVTYKEPSPLCLPPPLLPSNDDHLHLQFSKEIVTTEPSDPHTPPLCLPPSSLLKRKADDDHHDGPPRKLQIH